MLSQNILFNFGMTVLRYMRDWGVWQSVSTCCN